MKVLLLCLVTLGVAACGAAPRVCREVVDPATGQASTRCVGVGGVPAVPGVPAVKSGS